MKRILTIIWVAAAMQGVHVASLHAQDNDFGLDFSVGAEKKIRRGMDFGLEAEARTQDNTRKIDRWSLGASFGVKLLNTTTFDLKAGLKWEYLWVSPWPSGNTAGSAPIWETPTMVDRWLEGPRHGAARRYRRHRM